MSLSALVDFSHPTTVALVMSLSKNVPQEIKCFFPGLYEVLDTVISQGGPLTVLMQESYNVYDPVVQGKWIDSLNRL